MKNRKSTNSGLNGTVSLLKAVGISSYAPIMYGIYG